MNIPVDLTNLRSMTDGDVEMEKELFKEFFISFEAGMASLNATMAEAAAEAWRKETHALKGIALNLGANRLGELCKKGQEECSAVPDAKIHMLEDIRHEYEQVKQFLSNMPY